jgi:hypothetical protein
MREINPMTSNKQKLTDLKQQSSKKLPPLQKLSLGELDSVFGGTRKIRVRLESYDYS